MVDLTIKMLLNSTTYEDYFIIDAGNGSVFGEMTPEFYMDELRRLNDQQMMYLLPAIVYTSALMLVGAPGNLIVLYVYFFKWRRTASRVFILFLAGLDFVNCVSTLPIEIYLLRYPFMMDMPMVCKFARFGTYLMNASSAAILVAIAVDRFKRICKPYESNFTESTCKYICIGCIVLGFGITWPSLILYGTRLIVLEEGVVGKACLVENAYDKSPYPLAYFFLHAGGTLFIFAVLSVLYYFVGLQIYRRRAFKMRRCTRVQVVVEDKTTTDKSGSNDGNDDVVKQNGMSLQMIAESEFDKHTVDENDKLIVDQSTQTDSQENKEPTNSKSGSSKSNKHVNKIQDSNKGRRVEKCNSLKAEITSSFESSKTSSFNEKCSATSAKKRKTRLRHILLRGDSNVDASGKCQTHCLNFRIGKSTFMLFLITIAYIISFLPFYIIVIIRQSDKQFVQQMSVASYMACQLFLRSYLLSSAINPIIYSFCNERFRDFCVQLFRRSRRQGSTRSM